MEQSFAGVLASRTIDEGDRRRLAEALCGERGPASSAVTGRLALAWTAGRPGAEQPRTDGVTCVLDGRIERLAQLAEQLGVPPTTGAETLLALGYRRRGPELLALLRGEFALMIWDERLERGLLARDQLGVRPLFYCRRPGRLAFASEVGPLLQLLPSRPPPDDVALSHWLAGADHGLERTLYEGVRRLAPASWMPLGADVSGTPRRYWQPRYRAPAAIERSEAVDAVRRGLWTAVDRAAGSERRVGVMLSGGLDSAAVAAVAASSGRRVHACSVTFPRHPAADESSLIAEVAAAIRAERTTLPFQGGSALAAAERFIEEWELPPPVPNHFVWEPLTRAAALAGVRVMLDGEGGDEAFGLAPFLLADLVMHGRPLAALRYARAIPGARRSRRLMIEQLFEYGLLGAVPHGAHRRAAAGPSWLAPRARALLDQDRWRWKLADGPRWWAQLAYALTLQPERLGAWDYFRRRAASAGLTARHPLRDLDLVELVLGLRPELSFDAHLTRPLLREAMAGTVPDKVRLRAGKSLYDALAADALAGPDLAVARSLLAARDAEVRRYTEADSVARLLCVPRGAASGWSRPVWRLATAELWLRREAGGNALVHGPFLGFRDSTRDTTLVS